MKTAAFILAIVLAACASDPVAPTCEVPGYVHTIEHTDTLPDGSIVTLLGEEMEPGDCEPGVGACVCLDRWLGE